MTSFDSLAYISFLLISVTSLLPWNLFMNAHEYFHYKLRNDSEEGNGDLVPAEASTELQRSYEGWVTLTSGASCVLGSLINLLCTESLSNSLRIRLGHAIVVLALLPTILLTYVNTDAVQLAFFVISMLLASLASFGSIGLIGSGLLGLAAKFPAKHVQAVMFGQAVAGILSSLLSIACQGLTSNALLHGRFFFMIATVWSMFSILIHEYLIKSDGINALTIQTTDLIDTTPTQRLLDETENEDDNAVSVQRTFPDVRSVRADALSVWSQTKIEWLAGFVVLVGTLSAFPGLSSLVETSDKHLVWQNYFTSVACFLLFNCGDAFGRVAANYVMLNRKNLLLLSLLRLLFVPFFFFCNIKERHHSITIFHNDLVFIAAMALFSITNGLLLTLANMIATGKVSAELRELTGSMFGLMGVLSTFIGSILGLLLIEII